HATLPPPPTPTLFPYTTLFRSDRMHDHRRGSSRQTKENAGSQLGGSSAKSTRCGSSAWKARASGPVGSPEKPPRTWGRQEERARSEEHTSELQSRGHLVCRLLL